MPSDHTAHHPQTLLWNLAKRFHVLSNRIHPNLGPHVHNPCVAFLSLKIGRPLLSMRRWGYLPAEITAEQPTVVALQDFHSQKGSHHVSWTAALEGTYVPVSYGVGNLGTQFLVHNSIAQYVTKTPSTGNMGCAMRLSRSLPG